MTTFQPPTKQAIREISTGFSSFCTEEKTKSISPNKSTNGKRKIVRARRGSQRNQQQQENENNNNNDINITHNNKEKKFEEMNNSQYMEYQKQTEQHRMKRKRKFDVFSSGSNESLQEILEQPQTFRVPYHSFLYVRVDNQNNSQLQQQTSNTNNTANNNNTNIENEMKSNSNNSNSNNSNNKNTTKNAFEMMTKASKAINDWSYIEAKLGDNNNNDNNDKVDDDNDTKMDQDDDDEIFNSVIRDNNGSNIFYPVKEECMITRSVRVSSEWVSAFNEYEMANNIAWKEFNSDGKIHEYQINRNSGIMLLDLNEKINEEFLNENEKEIKQWVIDHGFSGFICNSCFYLFQPHLYWNLLDDNKRSKIKQALISDMFQTSKTKPNNNAWKAWKATF